MSEYSIRRETPEDYRAVEELTREAFWNVYKPGADEHYFIHQMRNHPDFIPELAFVAELDGRIIGNIMYTKAWLEDETGTRKEILSFGPLCVAREYQRHKVGSALIEHSFGIARGMGYDVNINFGNPGNYVGRGFVSCKKKNVSFAVEGNYPTALLVCELVPNALDGKKWMYIPSSTVIPPSSDKTRKHRGEDLTGKGITMKVFIVYCHPSEDSFTSCVRDAFISGLKDAGHEYIVSDLYKMDFKTDMTEAEYLRDAYYRNTPAPADDVLAEQAKINASDVIVFIYPVFWSEAPAKLVGWFDRVWTYGFAYGEKTMKTLEKGLILCSAGNPRERLEEFGILDSMKKVMLGDRLFGRVKQAEFVVFDNTSREYELREKNWEQHLKTAYEKGKNLLTHP